MSGPFAFDCRRWLCWRNRVGRIGAGRGRPAVFVGVQPKKVSPADPLLVFAGGRSFLARHNAKPAGRNRSMHYPGSTGAPQGCIYSGCLQRSNRQNETGGYKQNWQPAIHLPLSITSPYREATTGSCNSRHFYYSENLWLKKWPLSN